MPPGDTSERRSSRANKRMTKACRRCRDQKIRCTGSYPCDQCSKRKYVCHFDSQSERVLVTRRYISDLNDRIAALQRRVDQATTPGSTEGHLADPRCGSTTELLPSKEAHALDPGIHDPSAEAYRPRERIENKTPLTNPLAFHITDWVPDPTGNPLFMGTSSGWAFSRRVLGMTHEKLTGMPLFPDPDKLLFDDHVYNLNWDGNRANYPADIFDVSNLPTADFAEYLISSVKFHCGQLFYLFDDQDFRKKLTIFQKNPAVEARSSPLWFCHYLLLLAFGKIFVLHSSGPQGPAGAEHFIHAMQCMPDFTFYNADPIERIQVMCCAALYLQSIHSRGPAYRMIGHALRLALEYGMHTEMHGICLDVDFVQRSRLVWWTVYVLERRMSSLLGVPMGISEESISASFPSASTLGQSSIVLEMQVMLCQILAKVDLTVYGIDGKLDIRYLSATQSVLRDIASVTERLNGSFVLFRNGSMTGTSRISAHLHILEHQCIVLTLRPLLYIFLQSKLGQSDPALMDWLRSGTVKALLHVCVESAQQTLRILSALLEQGILETFMPFDLDAASMSTISLLLAAAIDPSLVQDHSPWTRLAYSILDYMSARGNPCARLLLSESKQLDNELAHLASETYLTSADLPADPRDMSSLGASIPSFVPGGSNHSTELELAEMGQHYELSSNQLMDLANSIDLDSLTWPFSPIVQGL